MPDGYMNPLGGGTWDPYAPEQKSTPMPRGGSGNLYPADGYHDKLGIASPVVPRRRAVPQAGDLSRATNTR